LRQRGNSQHTVNVNELYQSTACWFRMCHKWGRRQGSRIYG